MGFPKMSCLALALSGILGLSGARAAEPAPAPIPPEKFTALHELIKPQAGESRWREIPWLTSIWEARKKAAAEGKPIFIIYGGGAAPIGGC
jgi:hypothetical protein